MLCNVSALLREPVGATRTLHAEGERARVPAEDYEASVSGSVELMRTARGVLVRARLSVRPRTECARCLTAFEQQLTLEFDEEFVLERDPESGEPVPDLTPDDFRIDERQHLDLSEAVRQYEQAALPLHPVCRPDCAGLCSTCGTNLNGGRCSCPPQTGGRWQALAALSTKDQERS